MNSVNGGREGDGGGSKTREKKDMMNGGPKFGPTLRTQHVAESTPKKKSFSFLFISFPTPKKLRQKIIIIINK